MTKQRQRQLEGFFAGYYRANMTAKDLVNAVHRMVEDRRPKRRDDFWSFDRLVLKTRLATAAEYVAFREEKERNRPAIYNVLYTDQNEPSSNVYDCQPGEWNYVTEANGRARWDAVSVARRRTSVCFATTDITDFYPALVRLAIGLKAAFLISGTDSIPHPFRAVLVAPGETRFRSCGPNFEAARVPPGTALLFPGEPEETGRIVLWQDGDTDRFAVTVWGRFFAAQIDSGFQSSHSVPVSP